MSGAAQRPRLDQVGIDRCLVMVPVGYKKRPTIVYGQHSEAGEMNAIVFEQCANVVEAPHVVCRAHWHEAPREGRRELMAEQHTIGRGRVTKRWGHIVQLLLKQISRRLEADFIANGGGSAVRTSDTVPDTGEAGAQGSAEGGAKREHLHAEGDGGVREAGGAVRGSGEGAAVEATEASGDTGRVPSEEPARG